MCCRADRIKGSPADGLRAGPVINHRDARVPADRYWSAIGHGEGLSANNAAQNLVLAFSAGRWRGQVVWGQHGFCLSLGQGAWLRSISLFLSGLNRYIAPPASDGRVLRLLRWPVVILQLVMTVIFCCRQL